MRRASSCSTTRPTSIAVAEGVSRFLAVESCGQCEPCKRDGLAVAAALDDLRRSETDGDVTSSVRDWLGTITDGARCYLATQHQVVATSILDRYPESVAGHVDRSVPAAERVLIAPIVDIEDGQVVLDTSQADKQPDWSYEAEDSGRWPAAYLGDTPVDVSPRRRAASVGPVTSPQDTGDDGGTPGMTKSTRSTPRTGRFSSMSATSSTSCTTNWSARSSPPRHREATPAR